MAAEIFQLRAMSAFANRLGLAIRAGITYDGKRDLNKILGYKDELLPEDYWARYKRDGVAARIVETFPEATWRGGGEVWEDQDPSAFTTFEKAYTDLAERLSVWTFFERVDVLAGLGHYAVLFLGADDGADFYNPLEKLKPEGLRYLTPYSEQDAVISKFDTDPQSERFGLPELYQITMLRNVPGARISSSGVTKVVHWSRVIHVADGLLDSHIWGTPRLERVWNRLDDLEKVVGGGAEAFWLRANQGLQLNIDPNFKFNPAEKDGALAKFNEELEKYEHGITRILKTRGVEAKTLGSDVANFANPVQALFDILSAATGIPQRILMGAERGELASSQDQSNFDDAVENRRASYAHPTIVKPFVERLIELGALPKPKEFFTKWPEIKNLTLDQRATQGIKLSTINKQQGEIVIMADEIRTEALGLPPFTEEQKKEIADQQQKAQEQAMALKQKMGPQPAGGGDTSKGAAVDTGVPKPITVNPRAKNAADVVKVAVAYARSRVDRDALKRALEGRDPEQVREILRAATHGAEAALRLGLPLLLEQES